MTHSSLVLSNSELIGEAFEDYFTCEFVGHTPGRCDRNGFEKFTYPYLSIIAYLFIGLIPISILNFVINWQSMKEFCLKKCKISEKKYEVSSSEFSAHTSSTSAISTV